MITRAALVAELIKKRSKREISCTVLFQSCMWKLGGKHTGSGINHPT